MDNRSHFIGFVITSSPKAVLFHDHFWHAPEWLPKNHITLTRNPENEDGGEAEMRVAHWLVKANNFNEFEERENEEEPNE